MSIKSFDECPWTGDSFGWKQSHSGNESTSNFDFSGGWKDDGKYGYTSVNSGFELDVVPNWDKLTWIGTAPICGKNRKSQCTSSLYQNKTGVTAPKKWAGYISVKRDGVDNEDDDKLIVKEPDGCNNCGSGNMVLCTLSDEMLNNSCPGINLQSKPTVVTGLDYYAGSIANYPRGRGKCFYDKNIIKNDPDLDILLNLKRNNLIHGKLVDELAGNYCYSTKSGSCGNDPDKKPISKCIKYKIDEMSDNSASKPCIKWRNSKIGEGDSGKELLDRFAQQWCNDPNNKYTPLCDCWKKTDVGTNTIKIRNFYSILTDTKMNPNTAAAMNVIPTHCWYKPCQLDSYSIPVNVVSGDCPANVNICNQINTADTGSSINDIKQTLSCSIAQPSGQKTITSGADNNPSNDGSTDITKNFVDQILENFPMLKEQYVYIPIIIFIVAIIIAFIINAFNPKKNNNYSYSELQSSNIVPQSSSTVI